MSAPRPDPEPEDPAITALLDQLTEAERNTLQTEALYRQDEIRRRATLAAQAEELAAARKARAEARAKLKPAMSVIAGMASAHRERAIMAKCAHEGNRTIN